jgi:uncharacterized protein YfaS (alpha-2-macroglobulin family)
VVYASARYVPEKPGSQADARNRGFVVQREQIVQRATPARTALDEGGRELALTLGEVVEDHLTVVNPEDRTYVAIELPFAAGLEPLNPRLQTSPPEATPSKPDTIEATWVSVGDASVTWYFERLPKGTYDFRFRSRAMTGRSLRAAARQRRAAVRRLGVGNQPGRLGEGAVMIGRKRQADQAYAA